MIHTDDMAATASTTAKMDLIVRDLHTKIDITDLGEICWMLGIEIAHDRMVRTILLSQTAYIDRITKCNLDTAYPVWTPLSVDAKGLSSDRSPLSLEEIATMTRVPYRATISSLMYTSMCTRPNITFAVNRLSQFSINPGEPHWAAAKHVLIYLNSTHTLPRPWRYISLHLTYRLCRLRLHI
jgi:hypothetical protein